MPPATRGRTRRKRWTLSSGTTLFRQPGVPWVPFTNCQKKEGSHPLLVRRIAPSSKGTGSKLRKKYLLVVAITTKRLLGLATQEKAEVPPSALFDAFIPFGMMHLYVHFDTNSFAIGRTAH